MIIFLKNIVKRELDVNRHIHTKPSAKSSTSEKNVKPTIESAKRNLKGLHRNAWVSSSFMVILLLLLTVSTNMLSTIMMFLLLLLVIMTIYTNSHNILNHQRWLNGDTLLDKKEFLRVFVSQPHLVLINTLLPSNRKPKRKKKKRRKS